MCLSFIFSSVIVHLFIYFIVRNFVHEYYYSNINFVKKMKKNKRHNVNENHIGHKDTQTETDRQTNILLLLYKDKKVIQ